MGKEASRSDRLLSLILLAIGAMHAVRVYRYVQSRVVQPGARDPARSFTWLLIWGYPSLSSGSSSPMSQLFTFTGAMR